jgi:osmotically-inducible protein OsmY
MKTDKQLRADVEAELRWDSSVDDRAIIVAAKDGVVTLAGEVKSYVDKWSAEKAAKYVAGVRAVANEIEVRPIGSAMRLDKDIAESAAKVLNANLSVPPEVKAIVDAGWITLDGDVAYWYQRNAAEQAVRSLWGVRGITNNISVRPHVSVANVQGKIHEAFKRHADLDADKVHVTVSDGAVTLTGKVHSWHEREDAELAAWSAPGVTRVKNDLAISL